MKKLFENWKKFIKENEELVEAPGHGCATHVSENATGREGHCVFHNWNETLQEVTAYDVDFGDEIVKNIPVSELTILEANLAEEHPGHMAKKAVEE